MVSGYILGIMGLIMFIPAGIDMMDTGNDWSHFISTAMAAMFFGFSLFLSNYTKIERINLKQAYLITVTSWLLVWLFAAIPFRLYGIMENSADFLFETMSGLTGTGASVLSEVESLPRAILLWRSMLNGIGGLGIVIFAVALLPFLGIGGMQIFQRENSDSNDKFMPKFSYIAKRIMAVYFILIIACFGALVICGMDWFDAVNHALSAIGTGGFSTKNHSIETFNSFPVELVIMASMLAGSLPMTYYILLARGNTADKNSQVSVFLLLTLTLGLFVSGWLCITNDYTLGEALRYSIFNVISVITTTGFYSADFTQWGIWAPAVFILLSFSGGCTGSTSGSVKIFRWQAIYAFLRKYILSAIEPNRVIPLRIGRISTSEKVVISVFVYVLLFILSTVFICLAISLCGVNFTTSIAAAVACITNVGVGSIDIIGPEGNYGFFSDSVKYILCFAMFLGRLEVVTVLVIFSKSFWRR